MLAARRRTVPVNHHPHRRPWAVLLAAALAAAAIALTGGGDAAAQEEPPEETTSTAPSSTTVVPPTTPTSLLIAPNPDDPTQGEGVETGDVPIDPSTVPPRVVGPGEVAATAAVVRGELGAAQATAQRLGTSYSSARQRTVQLEAELDVIERDVTSLAGIDRTAVRRVEAARRLFENRAINALIRGGIDDYLPSIPTGDPNEMASARALLGAVLDADREALDDYRAAREATDADLVAIADRLFATRAELATARAAMIESRRRSVSAQMDVQVLSAGSDIIIRGFVFPVGNPHSFSNSFGAPRMVGTEYFHSHQGTDILAPFGTPLLACERGIITKVSTSVLGGISFWLKGESGTYYYYAHLQRYADGFAKGNLVDAGTVLGYVGDTGNAKGTPHLHFEIHPDGGGAVNPYPLLKVVDQLAAQAAANG